jgi:D-alanyl-lipoteichoic acid acyltransferase DltB (MBOAT superfamily)
VNFASWTFVGLFLPLVLGSFLLIRGSRAAQLRQALLIAASLAFYSVSGAENLALLAASVALNYSAGALLGSERLDRPLRRALMWAAVAGNVGALAWFKWLALAAPAPNGFLSSEAVLVPLAFSFITFQQIGFIAACYRRQIARPSFFNYLFFVAFFPQLIIGPIVTFRSIDEQLARGFLVRTSGLDLAVGFSIFLFGLGKKTLLADRLAVPVDRIFEIQAMAGATPFEAWYAITVFQLQLFLDFSAYSDMAIGLGRMFGIALPINFDRPLSAVDRFDMWRRWHITFVQFMRSHVFRPLVRNAGLSPPVALAVTALLSSLWHGFGWTFILWATVQTAILLASHYRGRWRRRTRPSAGPRRWLAILLTFVVTALLGTLFRSPSLGVAGEMYAALLPLGGDGAGDSVLTSRHWLFAGIAALVVWGAPDARQLFERYWTATDPRPDPPPKTRAPGPRFRLTRPWAVAAGLFTVLVLAFLGHTDRFVYVQF